MMRLNLQLTMGTFSLSLFGLIGVAFGMNLESSLEEVRVSLSKRGAVFSCFEGPFLRQALHRKSSRAPPPGTWKACSARPQPGGAPRPVSSGR